MFSWKFWFLGPISGGHARFAPPLGTSMGWLPALSPSSLWLGSSRASCAFSEVSLVKYLSNALFSFYFGLFCLALASFWITLKIFDLCHLVFDSEKIYSQIISLNSSLLLKPKKRQYNTCLSLECRLYWLQQRSQRHGPRGRLVALAMVFGKFKMINMYAIQFIHRCLPITHDNHRQWWS